MEPKKVLFAYDGSACANEALDDIKRAGLPQELDLLIVSVAEVWVLESSDEDEESAQPAEHHVIAISAHAKKELDRARVFAEHAAKNIREMFPAWTVETRVYPDSPAWGVLHAAEKWKPDLIIMGSHGRSALGRFFLGSVSQKVLSEAQCSVRVARHRDYVEGSPVRLLVGVDGTPDSYAAIDEIAMRDWPAGSSVKVLAAVGPIGAFVGPEFNYDLVQWQGVAKQWEQMKQVTARVAEKLRDAGLVVDTKLCDGAPVAQLLDEARELGADCIFLGARGHRFMDRFLLGSVSAAVTARASCSVEVIRTAKAADQKSED